MKKVTVVIPGDLHLRVAMRAKQHGIRMDSVIEEALLRYFEQDIKALSSLFMGPMAGLDSADRKRVEAYIEFVKLANLDLKKLVARRISQFRAIARGEMR